MCYAIIQTTLRDGKPQQTTVDNPADLIAKRDECATRPEATKVVVFIRQPHLSVKRIEEWRPLDQVAPDK